MHWVYVIQNTSTREIYIGKTNDLRRRLVEHNTGQQTATKRKNGEWIIVYAEVYRNKLDADERELKLKQHGSNKKWLLDRIKNSLIKN